MSGTRVRHVRRTSTPDGGPDPRAASARSTRMSVVRDPACAPFARAMSASHRPVGRLERRHRHRFVAPRHHRFGDPMWIASFHSAHHRQSAPLPDATRARCSRAHFQKTRSARLPTFENRWFSHHHLFGFRPCCFLRSSLISVVLRFPASRRCRCAARSALSPRTAGRTRGGCTSAGVSMHRG